MLLFADRKNAGEMLARKLANMHYDIVLALPRGGVPIAYEIATKLGLPWDVLLVRKLGCPGNQEIAIGAISNHGEVYINQSLVRTLAIDDKQLEQIIEEQSLEIARREKFYPRKNKKLDLKGKHVLIVDDGVATGATAKVAIQAIKHNSPASIACAFPVIPSDTKTSLESLVDSLIVLQVPDPFYAVGQFYQNFDQVSDDDVVELMKK